ncbi:hypothetical protein [Marivita sp.]|uniref:hypothetical protein n=1 Tax=Marivita sp. TaxID=2003365 RepID=UPI003F72198E
MIGKLLKSLFKLGFLATGLTGVIATWDYTQQAGASENGYSLEHYKVSVLDRFGDEAGYAFAAFDTAKSGVSSGLEWAEESGLLQQVGLDMPIQAFDTDKEPVVATSADTVMIDAPVQLASAKLGLAPETSLFPRARVLD